MCNWHTCSKSQLKYERIINITYQKILINTNVCLLGSIFSGSFQVAQLNITNQECKKISKIAHYKWYFNQNEALLTFELINAESHVFTEFSIFHRDDSVFYGIQDLHR